MVPLMIAYIIFVRAPLDSVESGKNAPVVHVSKLAAYIWGKCGLWSMTYISTFKTTKL